MGDTGFLEVDGGRIYYEVEGAGHPLLLIHGGLGSLRMWDGNVPAFARRLLVIRFDTRGFGRTGTEDVPTLVMVGAVDAPAEVEAGHHLAKSVTDARLVEFPGVAHMIHLEEPE